MTKFFVYGTLMTKMSNHRVIPQDSIESIEKATINKMDLYAIRHGHFPCMIEGTGQVIGEVITIKKEHSRQATKMMDQLEGYHGAGEDNFYNRVKRTITLSDGSKAKANVYLFNVENGGLGDQINDGDFRAWRTNK